MKADVRVLAFIACLPSKSSEYLKQVPTFLLMTFLTEGKKVPMNVPTKQIRDIRAKELQDLARVAHGIHAKVG